MLSGMLRVSLGVVAALAVAGCGQTEHGTTGAGPAGEDSGGAGSGGSASLGAAGGAGVSGLAGMGSFSQQSAVDECQRYCELPINRLPQALCEDWNKSAWDPPFCDLDPSKPCAEYCNDVYQTVTPQCAALLAPVIRCVAPVYASGELKPCFLSECYRELSALTSACYGLQKTLAEARATWQASGVVDYQLTYSRPSVEAEVTVRAGLEPMVTPANATALTVPLLFDLVDHYLDGSVGYPTITYDADLGYVRSLSIFQGCQQSFDEVSAVEVAPLR
jgi:hypothetical protein